MFLTWGFEVCGRTVYGDSALPAIASEGDLMPAAVVDAARRRLHPRGAWTQVQVQIDVSR